MSAVNKLDLRQKISVLAGAAKYDAACATSGGQNSQRDGPAGVCHSWTADGRCVSLLKVLYSNACRYDCAYCANRASADIRRSSFTAGELAELATEFYRRNYIEGLFLSSGIFSDPDIVMEKLIETARLLRESGGFGGYIHLKIIPGATEKMIREAGLLADRLSVNIELPTDKSLQYLAPQKSGKEILGAMRDFADFSAETQEAGRRSVFLPGGKAAAPDFAPAGQSTQLIVGATGEDDRQIINLTSSLYKKFALARVYYSAFLHPGPADPSGGDPRLPALPAAPLLREHRLYQADWLLRFYHFGASEILSESEPFLDLEIDPKTAWALKNIGFFPVEVKSADYETLLRVPGIGAKTARRILETRRSRSLNFDHLKRLGAALKRARYFLTCSGSFIERPDDPHRIRRLLAEPAVPLQLPLFDF